MLLLFIGWVCLVDPVYASYGKTPSSRVDPAIVRIDEEKYLGVRLAKDYVMRDADGREFALGDMMGKPLVLVLSYFSCDGACSAINKTLRDTLNDMERWKLGQDYRVLTVSFDRNDTADNLRMFLHHAGFRNGLPAGWNMAMLKDPQDIQRLTASMGYKFQWDPRDQVFLHPSVYMVLTPEGRVMRFLYAASADGSDMDISITKAYGGQLLESNAIGFFEGACYSYNYKEGKYTLNYPLFIALAALGVGVTSLAGGTIIMKRRIKHENKDEVTS